LSLKIRVAALPLPFVAVLALAPAAHAQFSAYATFSPTHLSGVRNGNSSFSSANNGYTTTSFWTEGVGGGVTFNVLPLGPVKLGLDLRGSTMPGTNGADLVLGGVKLGVNVPLVRFKPYVQASGGYLGTRTRIVGGAASGSSENDKFAVYEVLGGIDYGLVPFFDLRLVEVGAGRGYNISGAGTTSGNYQVTLFTINTGLVFHF